MFLPHVTSYPFNLNTLLSYTLSLFSSLKVRDKVPHSYKTVVKILAFYVFIFRFLVGNWKIKLPELNDSNYSQSFSCSCSVTRVRNRAHKNVYGILSRKWQTRQVEEGQSVNVLIWWDIQKVTFCRNCFTESAAVSWSRANGFDPSIGPFGFSRGSDVNFFIRRQRIYSRSNTLFRGSNLANLRLLSMCVCCY